MNEKITVVQAIEEIKNSQAWRVSWGFGTCLLYWVDGESRAHTAHVDLVKAADAQLREFREVTRADGL